MSDQSETLTTTSQKSPFSFTTNGITYRAIDLVAEMTIRQTERLSGIVGNAFPILMDLSSKDDVTGSEFIGLITSLLDSGKVRQVLALLIVPTDGEQVSEADRLEAAGEIPNGKAVELIQGFFGSIGG